MDAPVEVTPALQNELRKGKRSTLKRGRKSKRKVSRAPKRDPKRRVQRQRKVGNLKERVRRTNPILRVPPKLPLFPPRHVGVRLLQRAPKMSIIPIKSPRKLGVPIQSRKGLGRGDLGGTVSYQIKSLDAEAAASFSVAVGLARKMALEAVLQPWFGSKRRLGREMGMEG